MNVNEQRFSANSADKFLEYVRKEFETNKELPALEMYSAKPVPAAFLDILHRNIYGYQHIVSEHGAINEVYCLQVQRKSKLARLVSFVMNDNEIEFDDIREFMADFCENKIELTNMLIQADSIPEDKLEDFATKEESIVYELCVEYDLYKLYHFLSKIIEQPLNKLIDL